MADQVRSRKTWYNALKRLETKVKALDPATISKGEIKANLESAEAIWKKLDTAHAQILAVMKDDDGFDHEESVLEPMNDCYIAIKSKLYSLESSNLTAAAADQATTARPNLMKLPDIKLPSFDGKYEDWPAFKDLFKASIGNHSSLSGAMKLHYLKHSTTGQAASLIKSFMATDGNYQEAWNLLEQQYNNEREIIYSLVRKLLFQPSIKHESATALQEMLNTTLECIRSLKVLKRPTDQWDDIVVTLLTEKFDSCTRAEWARALKGTKPSTFAEIQDFITQHVRTLHARGQVKPPPPLPFRPPPPAQPPRVQPPRRHMNSHHTSVSTNCQYCHEPHQMFMCQKLRDMPSDKRFAAVKATRVCINCLKDGHTSKQCTSTGTCKRCSKRHNTFLHVDQQQPTGNISMNHVTTPAPQPPPQGATFTTTPHAAAASTTQAAPSSANTQSYLRINTASMATEAQTLLKTAIVTVYDDFNNRHQLRVCLDDGGEGGLIRESLVHKLGLPKQRVNVTVSGVGGEEAMKAKWKCNVRLYSTVNMSFFNVDLYAVRRVTGSINRLTPDHITSWNHLSGLQLADPQFHKGGEVDILLGADVVPYILQDGLVRAGINEPVAQNTIFGWVLFGKAGTTQSTSQSAVQINNFKCEISNALRRFWEIEEVPQQEPLTIEEKASENHFVTHYKRLSNGQYMVRLPFKNNVKQLGESRQQALRRLYSLERRFRKEPQYKEAYIKFMQEYETLGHMEVITQSTSTENAFYLPHHFVLKSDSTTTKQRTVFDGSAKSTSGLSLNDTLMVGATVQKEMYTLLIEFRYHEVAWKADIAMMYRKFLLHPEDRTFQRILWREDSSKPIKEYTLNTVTYGITSSAHHATRCLKQLADDEENRYPDAAYQLRNIFYVDDHLSSCATTEKANKLIKEMIQLVAAGGMQIRKWCSNSSSVMNQIPEELREEGSIAVFDDNSDTNFKALGIKWQPSTDEFLFTINVDLTSVPTKRHLLSEISKTFDPIGWLSPVTVRAKLLLQKIWLAGNEWDEPVSDSLRDEWNTYQQDLQRLEHIRVPRCIMKKDPIRVELHGYCDSSEMAYASAVYIKCVYSDASISIHLITSRTRVAPLKCVSLPKLELCGAKLLADTIQQVVKTVPVEHEVYCWTDSSITLRWITSHSRKWKTFVANRVSDIQSIIPPQHWGHVRSEDNPADLPSRGISSEELLSSELWKYASPWLATGNYPHSLPQFDETEAKKEERAKQIFCLQINKSSAHSRLFNAYSTLSTLLRRTAYIIRSISSLKNKTKLTLSPPTTTELYNARNKLIMWSQQVSFHLELDSLKKRKCVQSSSKLIQLNPFTDGNGILRVGGRIQNADIPESAKHPIILDSKHKLTELIIRSIHHQNMHSGFTLTHATISQEFWILGARDTIRHSIRRCITCRRATARTTEQLMGNLPVGRVNPGRPFLHCGVDFAGPYLVKMKKGRHIPVDKSWFCIFVCLATKAVHLEAVTSLSSDAFIACYQRFVSRRGISAVLYSDCGTNFVGANKILKEWLTGEETRLQSSLASLGTDWIFNSPAAPHQGGLWEAGVKSVKFHFTRTVGQTILNLEQFMTLLCRVESCLNSRPLYALSSQPGDFEALTPGHFLIGGPLNSVPEPDVTNITANRLSYWETIRQMTQHFWQRWSREYLTSLQKRFKWTQKRENLKLGELVIVGDDQLPVGKWKLGRIISVHPGADGLVRSATVKTLNGTFKRPITKLNPELMDTILFPYPFTTGAGVQCGH